MRYISLPAALLGCCLYDNKKKLLLIKVTIFGGVKKGIGMELCSKKFNILCALKTNLNALEMLLTFLSDAERQFPSE